MKVTILDDYQTVALKLADWSPVRRWAGTSEFNDHAADTAGCPRARDRGRAR
jgi:hypothetical protein